MTALQRFPAAVKAAGLAVKAVFSIGGSGYDAMRFGFHAFMTRWNPAYGFQRLVKLAAQNPQASRGLRLISQLMASVPIYVERRGPEGWETPERHGFEYIMELFDRPGARTGRQAFYDLITTSLYAGGEFWLDKGEAPMSGPNRGRPRSLRVILPDEFVDFVRDQQTDEITGYRFRRRHRGTEYERAVEDCLHVRLPDPTDPDRGLAIFVAGQSMSFMKAVGEWNESIAQGGGRVPGYWVPKSLPDGKQLTEEQVKQAQANFDRTSHEMARLNADMVLSGSFERAPGDITPKDADWTRGMAMAIRQIATMMGIPATLLGDEKAGSLTDSGVDSEVRATYLLTVLPLLERVLDEVSHFLLPDGYRLWYDRDQVPALQEDMNAMWERYGAAFREKIITRDEARLALGYEELGGEHAEISTASPFPEFGGDGASRSAALRSLDEMPEPDFQRLFA